MIESISACSRRRSKARKTRNTWVRPPVFAMAKRPTQNQFSNPGSQSQWIAPKIDIHKRALSARLSHDDLKNQLGSLSRLRKWLLGIQQRTIPGHHKTTRRVDIAENESINQLTRKSLKEPDTVSLKKTLPWQTHKFWGSEVCLSLNPSEQATFYTTIHLANRPSR